MPCVTHEWHRPVRDELAEAGWRSAAFLDVVLTQQVDPGQVFDLTLPFDGAAGGYPAMDERRATKTLLQL